ncbi:MAG: adenylate/guanylate cyclase domain-containing protein [Phycisphaerales bacterium]|nr:adenylate/guanylate cyclase domain-containing protein [Hyphomonadaceae bacterium]
MTSKPRRQIRNASFYWGFVALFLAAVTIAFVTQPALLQSLRLIAFDTYQRLAPAAPLPDSPVRIVAIDEEALARQGQWPWPRSMMAQLTDELRDAGASAIVFDILFAEPDRTSPEQMLTWLPQQRRQALSGVIADWPTHDVLFAEALAESPTILAVVLHNEHTEMSFPLKAGFAVAGDDPGAFVVGFPGVSDNLPILSEAAQGVGFINWVPDGDQIVRRAPLLALQGETLTPSLDLETLRVAQGASTIIVRSSNAHGATAFGRNTGVNEVRVGGATIPTGPSGDISIHFRASQPELYISAARVLNGEIEPGALNGAIVLVGATAPGLLDLRATPLDAAIPGVEIHQQIIEQIIAGNYLTRPDFAPGIEWLVAMLAVLLVAAVAERTSAAISATLGIALIGALLAGGAVLFATAGYLFDPVFPAACVFVFAASAATYLHRRAEVQRAEIRRAFSQYVAPSIVKELAAHPERLKLGGEVRDLTLLVCDIRNFTTIAEKLSAEEMTAFINSFLTPLTDIIIESGGTIDKYMGDAILAFWNAPMDDAQHALHALEASRHMGAKMRDLNVKWRAEAAAAGRAFNDVSIGIGVNSGECCVGNLGSDRHFDYSAIGDAVNVTARLESLTKVYGLMLLVGEETVTRAPNPGFVEVDLVRVKGRGAPSRIFTLLPDGDSLPAEHQPFLKAYRGGHWDEARALLTRLQDTSVQSLQKLYAAYAQRLARLAAAPAEGWDGVYDFETK